MKVRARLLLGFAVIIVLLWGIMSVAAWNVRSQSGQIQRVATGIVPGIAAANDLEATIAGVYHAASGVASAPTPEAVAAVQAGIDRLAALENDGARLAVVDPDGSLAAQTAAFRRELADFLNATGSGGNVAAAYETVGSLFTMLSEDVSERESALLAELEATRTRFSGAFATGQYLLFGSAAFLTLVAVIAATVTSRSIVKPLVALREGTEKIAAGDLAHRVGTEAGDEIGELSRSFDHLTSSLVESTASVENLYREITARQQAEQDLKESEERLRTYLENAPDGIVMSRMDGTILYCNGRAEELTGYRRNEMIGKNFVELDLFPEAYLPKALEGKRRYMAGKRVGPDDFQIRRKDGSLTWVAMTAAPVKYQGQSVVLRFIRDVSERKKEEEIIRLEREKAQHYLDVAGTMLVALDLDGCVTMLNRKGAQLLGFTELEARGRDWFETFIPADRRPGIRAVFAQLIRGEQQAESYETHPVVTARGEIRQIEWYNTIIRDGRGRVTGTLSSGEDVTERLLTAEKLRRLDEMKLEFLSNVSHELRTPLQSISGFTKLLLQGDVPDPARQREFLGIIDGETVRLEHLINSLLDLSRLETGKFRIITRPVAPAGVIRDSVKVLRSLAARQDFNVKLDVPGSLPVIEADPDRLHQVLLNLLGNAIKFGGPGNTVTVRARRKDGRLVVQVLDNGTGIAEEDREHLFERFYRGKGEKVQGGSGLGLYISREIIEAHGGSIKAENRPGGGSIFSFTLPLPEKGDGHERHDTDHRG